MALTLNTLDHYDQCMTLPSEASSMGIASYSDKILWTLDNFWLFYIYLEEQIVYFSYKGVPIPSGASTQNIFF